MICRCYVIILMINTIFNSKNTQTKPLQPVQYTIPSHIPSVNVLIPISESMTVPYTPIMHMKIETKKMNNSEPFSNKIVLRNRTIFFSSRKECPTPITSSKKHRTTTPKRNNKPRIKTPKPTVNQTSKSHNVDISKRIKRLHQQKPP